MRMAPYHELTKLYGRCLIEAALHRTGGNRTHAAAQLGLQRTYLLRLIRELECSVPPPTRGLAKSRRKKRAR